MKILLRFVPIILGILACGLVGAIGVMVAVGDTSGVASTVVGITAFIVGFGVFYLAKQWLDKRAQQA